MINKPMQCVVPGKFLDTTCNILKPENTSLTRYPRTYIKTLVSKNNLFISNPSGRETPYN